MPWEDLNRQYTERGVVLVLGAGVSRGSELPDWRGLLRRVSAHGPGGTSADMVDRLVAERVPLPVIASALEHWSDGRDDFVERVRRALYDDFPFFPGGVSNANRQAFVDYVAHRNPTLRAIAALCAVSTDGATFAPNHRIHAVVTFNLDTLLQVYVSARYGRRLLRTIERASAGRNPEKISIYHLHGVLRFDRHAGRRSKEATDAVVLTEQDYYDFFNTPTSLFNYTFLYMLREFPCLFVGLSMNDENIRRLLHFSKTERLEALVAEGEKRELLAGRTRRHFAILTHNDTAELDRVVEDSLHALGTEVLWIEGHEEIPRRLRAAYEAAGACWQHVA